MAPLMASTTRSEWLPDDPMAFEPTRLWKLPFITTWDDSRNQNHPTDFAEEAEKDGPARAAPSRSVGFGRPPRYFGGWKSPGARGSTSSSQGDPSDCASQATWSITGGAVTTWVGSRNALPLRSCSFLGGGCLLGLGRRGSFGFHPCPPFAGGLGNGLPASGAELSLRFGSLRRDRRRRRRLLLGFGPPLALGLSDAVLATRSGSERRASNQNQGSGLSGPSIGSNGRCPPPACV